MPGRILFILVLFISVNGFSTGCDDVLKSIQVDKITIGFMIIAALCLMLVSGCKCMTGDKASCASKSETPVVAPVGAMGEKPSRAMAEEVSLTATVTAIDYAKSHQLPVAFIDLNAQHVSC